MNNPTQSLRTENQTLKIVKTFIKAIDLFKTENRMR